MIAIGLDPGSIRTGYGVVRRSGSKLRWIGSGTITTDSKSPMEKRLLTIHEQLETVLTTYAPDKAAVEDVFFAKNAKSSLKLGQVRGAILLTLARRGIAVTSFPPALIKRSVVGAGRAAKGQVQRVVQAILGLKTLPDEDEGDALAVAICFLNASRVWAEKRGSG
jgi:crossover junction endodeoxyribonuclease RuvC